MEIAYRCDPEDKSCNAGECEDDIQSYAEFSTEPTKEDRPSCVQRVRIPLRNTWAR